MYNKYVNDNKIKHNVIDTKILCYKIILEQYVIQSKRKYKNCSR